MSNNRFINLKTNPSIFNVKPQSKNANINMNVFSNTTQLETTETPWSWWSAIMWAIFALGVILVIAGFIYALINKNTLSFEGDSSKKHYKRLSVAMLIIGLVFCFLPFIISIVAGIRMF